MSLLGMYEDVSQGDWQRDYLYRVSIIPPLLISGVLPEDIDIFITDFKAPGTKQKVIKQDFAGQWANFAGPLDSSGQTEATMLVDEGGKLYKFLESWHSMSGDDATASAFPKNQFIGSVSATLYKTDKSTPVMTTILTGAWIPELGELSLDKTQENLLKVKVIFAFDKRQVVFF
jgi:hypothetical protein